YDRPRCWRHAVRHLGGARAPGPRHPRRRMNESVVALMFGVLLSVSALAFVLYPLFFPTRRAAARSSRDTAAADDSAIVALREIEFDRATGKLSDADYAELRRNYGERALHEMRAARASSADDAADAVEARVRAYRRE